MARRLGALRRSHGRYPGRRRRRSGARGHRLEVWARRCVHRLGGWCATYACGNSGVGVPAAQAHPSLQLLQRNGWPSIPSGRVRPAKLPADEVAAMRAAALVTFQDGCGGATAPHTKPRCAESAAPAIRRWKSCRRHSVGQQLVSMASGAALGSRLCASPRQARWSCCCAVACIAPSAWPGAIAAAPRPRSACIPAPKYTRPGLPQYRHCHVGLTKPPRYARCAGWLGAPCQHPEPVVPPGIARHAGRPRLTSCRGRPAGQYWCSTRPCTHKWADRRCRCGVCCLWRVGQGCLAPWPVPKPPSG